MYLISWHWWNAIDGHKNPITAQERYELLICLYVSWALTRQIKEFCCKRDVVKYFAIRLRLVNKRSRGYNWKEMVIPFSHCHKVIENCGFYEFKIN